MAGWKDKLFGLLVICLLFFAVPIRVNKNDNNSEDIEHELFHKFINKYNKNYKQGYEEYKNRFATFKTRLKEINELNQKRTLNSSALYGITQFSDMTPSEFQRKHLKDHVHLKIHNHTHYRHRNKESDESIEVNRVKRATTDIPLKKDWRLQGVVTKVYDQKLCGACWAFSAIEVIESMNGIKTGVLQSLSVQEAIDCSGNSNMGCDGGNVCSLLNWFYVNSIKIPPENQYPYESQTKSCRLKSDQSTGVVVADYTCDYFVGNEDKMLNIIANHGPIAVAVNALPWQNYVSGVIQYRCDGSPSSLNHAVEIVGYDLTAEIPHYIVRNSWGPYFGDKGYLYIEIGSNMCGVGVEVASATV